MLHVAGSQGRVDCQLAAEDFGATGLRFRRPGAEDQEQEEGTSGEERRVTWSAEDVFLVKCTVQLVLLMSDIFQLQGTFFVGVCAWSICSVY